MRLIDADALIHELNNSHYPGAPYVDAGISIAIGKICDAPTIEPEYKEIDFVHQHKKLPVNLQLERKKGRWVNEQMDYGECSECGFYGMTTDFCPNCGAEMTEGEG